MHAQSCLTLCDLVDCSHQALLSMGFSKHEYWSGLPCPPPRDLPDPGIELKSPAVQADSLPLSHQGSPIPWINKISWNQCWGNKDLKDIYQFCSVAQLCPAICDPMDCSTPGFPVHHQLLELAQTHVHWVSDAIQPSHPPLSPFPPAFNLSQHQGLFQWVSSSHQVTKVLELQF